tara:strand:- start:100 stop:510 length:411 start_codon:yes stop_codon:yes gene_type:complete
MALGNHRVLQLVGPATHEFLQSALALLPLALKLPSQAFQWRAGSISHPTPLFQGKAKLLLKIRQGSQAVQQCCGDRPQFRFIDLAAQTPCGCESLCQLQQWFTTSAAPLSAELNGFLQIHHSLEAEAAISEAIEGQ